MLANGRWLLAQFKPVAVKLQRESWNLAGSAGLHFDLDKSARSVQVHVIQQILGFRDRRIRTTDLIQPGDGVFDRASRKNLSQ